MTGYLFAKVSILYAHNFMFAFPDPAAVEKAKKEYAKRIGLYQRVDIDEAMLELSRLLGDPRREYAIYQNPNFSAIIPIIKMAAIRRIESKETKDRLFLPKPKYVPEFSKTADETLNSLLGLFSEPKEDKALTPAEILDNERLERLQRGE